MGFGKSRLATRSGNTDGDGSSRGWGMDVRGEGAWLHRGPSPFVFSLKLNTMSSRSFRCVRTRFGPTRSFLTRNPLETRGRRLSPRITCPCLGEEVMFCDLVKVGMQIPFAPRVVELLRCFGLAPALITPLGFLKWVCFIRKCKQLDVPYSLNVFRCLFQAVCSPEGFTDFTNRGFELFGRAAKARGAKLRWRPMSLLDTDRFDDDYRYQSSYFMFQGVGMDWEVNPYDRGCPTLDKLTDDDIHCLRIFREHQKARRLEPISWLDLLGLGLADLELQPGFGPRLGISRAFSGMGNVELAREYERGCEETRRRVVDQLYQYDRQFPFPLIREVAILGSSLHPLPERFVEIDNSQSLPQDHALEFSAMVRAGESGLEEEKAGHAADNDETSGWCLLDAPEVGEDEGLGFARGSKLESERPSLE